MCTATQFNSYMSRILDTNHGNIVIIAVSILPADPIANSNATHMYSLTIIHVHRRDARTFLATAIISAQNI